MLKSLLKQFLIYALSLHMAIIGFPAIALAAPINTTSVIQMNERHENIDRIRSTMARDEVRSSLLEMGVNPEEVELRLDSLTDHELFVLNQQIDQLPAGGSVLGVLGALLIVLIVLEMLGVTNVFTKL
ncbi:MAG: PA2779 family protein [Candidatus Thiodiazotropha sp. (ex Ctena orbiculata)]|uniref:PA2779 family protein n=1 Tax=Candidatus Thiodiazotropha taylori TaxID=2792791 RepID=A0A944QV02_9GAMM|nr:PA2779 family protein [Candidatus Thiodiazotropha taylori]MBT2990692.1 PA2779 family protein [Candidatus Thiodiazotropha taylori]MBT2996680.1 PA2779 family protein [Candidatus Thiodiazotropha taylori]MBT3000720.1 PA2779 family protein [Candidatus Thiodiazotropha taylori]MBT3027537.1 PA2779 family protein [Candidatus Thiodiazotropha taylori]